jgi:uncharacterized protein YjiS (DUF1127 family)
MSGNIGVVRASAPAFGVSGLLAAFQAWRARRRDIARITHALEAMSNRELAELGISRSDIPAVARGECYSNFRVN